MDNSASQNNSFKKYLQRKSLLEPNSVANSLAQELENHQFDLPLRHTQTKQSTSPLLQMSERFTQQREINLRTLRKQASDIEDTASPMPFSKAAGRALSDLRLREENKAETQSNKT